MIETGDGTLKIPDLSVEDQDIYICRASNSAGVISNEISLRIRRGPKFVIKPQNKTVKIGEEVQFEWWVPGGLNSHRVRVGRPDGGPGTAGGQAVWWAWI